MPDPESDSSTPVRADARRNRDAVLSAAVRVLAERPDASMREIAEASGVGRTTVYRHFPQRDDLVGALYRQVADDATRIVLATVEASRAAWAAGDDATLDRIVAMTVELAGLGERYRFLDSHRELEAEIEALASAQGSEPLAAYLAEALRRGELRQDLSVVWMMDVIHGLTMVAATNLRTGASPPDDLRRMLAATVRGAFAPQPR